jgi:uncharacterized protein (TIGR02284 family)
MTDLISKELSTLNNLIRLNTDRIEGYGTAKEETVDTELTSVFTLMISHSRNFKNELSDLVTAMGETPIKGASTSGKVYQAWMDIKAAVTVKDHSAIISSCEFGEDVAIETYRAALANSALDPHIRSVIQRECSILLQDREMLKSLKASPIEV